MLDPMRGTDAFMRAAQTQALLVSINRMPSAERKEILDRFGPAGIEEVNAALPLTWLPMTVHMKLSDSLRDVSGSAGAIRGFRQAMAATFDRPLLRSFVSLTTGIFGVTPHGLLKRGDRIYDQVVRNVGELAYVWRGPAQGEAVLTGFPAQEFSFDCYVDGLHGCLLAALDLCKVRGEVTVLSKVATGSVNYELRWS